MNQENNRNIFDQINNTKIIKLQVEDELKKSFIAYAMAVNVSRAIPDVRDGLKPVHRRILYAMSELGLYSDKPYRKCARIVGDVLGKFHPHGDSAVYEALVRLAQDFSIRYTLVDGHGNFGSVDGDPPAAQRYTEARLSKIASEMLREIDKNTVDWYPNFDDTEMQPEVLPSRFPNLLVNGADGIAVGMATNIPPHNLNEVINGIIAQIDNPDITVDELLNYIPAPDYPTGGIIMARGAVRNAYKTGRGGVVIRARCEIEEFNNGTRQRIVVTELPYQVNKANLISSIADLVKNKRIEGISDIKEESDREGMRIVIDIKKDANAQVVLNTLYKHTDLQVSNGIIFLALANGEPKVMNIKEILGHYIEHQRQVITRRTQFDLDKALEREHILKGLVIALANIDEVIAIIKASSDRADATEKLMSAFELSKKQADAILETRLQRLTSLEVQKLKDELDELEKLIAELRAILGDDRRIMDIVKTELGEIKDKYGDARKTEISIDMGDIDIADLIEPDDVVISMTHLGYIKRMSTSEYHAQRRGGVGVTAHKPKDEDFVESMFITNTHNEILFFTNFGKVYTLMGYEIPEAQRTARGRAIINLLQLSDGEKVTAVIPVEGEGDGNLIMSTKCGYIKKTSVKEFEKIRKGGKIAIKLNEGDELIGVNYTEGTDEILLASASGKCIRFNEQDVRPMGRDTQGVKSMKLDNDDFVVDMAKVWEGCEVLTVSQFGYGKRSSIDDYRLQSRAGKGIKAGVFDEETGRLVNLKVVNSDDDVMIISDDGTVIRTPVCDIRVIGRNTKGVKIMRLKEGSSIVCVAPTPHEEEKDSAESEEQTSESSAENIGASMPEPAENKDISADEEA